MIYLYAPGEQGLELLTGDGDVRRALWIDLFCPSPEEVAEVEALGLEVPTLAEMEEIEISNRLYREAGADYMIVVLSGLSPDRLPVLSPVAMILTAERLITVRHHTPRPLETFPTRADKSSAGFRGAGALFLGLVEEILGRQADHLEAVGHKLDATARQVFGQAAAQRVAVLEQALGTIGAQGEVLSRVRLGLLTLKRALAYYMQSLDERPDSRGLRLHVKAQLRDLQALEVHGDFIAMRLSFASDATMGMVNLAQNLTARILSVVACLFLPPTLIASVFGMNFARIPFLASDWGFALSLALMIGSAGLTYAVFRWRRWL
ncbi:MAG: magnesium transporter [Proteobacteria bacterium]|nr:magnesium transporter [Pseudomonadota bacterium]MBS0573925.1 magnesium transporter [Pseudomonadota bacterium]